MGTPEQRLVSPVVQPQLATDDQRLVTAILRKDRKATAEFVERFADAVYSYLRARLFPKADHLDDLFQETFLAAWEHLPEFRSESPLETWLLGIARHKVEDYYRALFRKVETFDDQSEDALADGHSEINFIRGLDDERRNRRILEILGGLPETYSLVLLWRYWEKRSAREVAELTGKTEKAVERLLARARAHFRERWQNEGHDERTGLL